MPAPPAWIVVSSMCAIAWVARDWLAATRLLMLVIFVAPLIDWAACNMLGPRASLRSLPSTAALSLFLPLEMALLAWALQGAASASAVELAQRVLLVGVANGIFGMTIAHELLHRPGRLARVTADSLLLLALYGHFRITHLHIHHEHAATSDDPATPRSGETLYSFFGRSIVGSLEIAVAHERTRLSQAGLPSSSLENQVLRTGLMSLGLVTIVWLAFGAAGAFLFVGQALAAIYTVEALNYVQHYGLSRQNGTSAAWDWNGAFTNWLMLDLGDHNRHHADARRLVSPSWQLPSSYLLMIAVAAVPPLWRKVMDGRVVPMARNAEGVQ